MKTITKYNGRTGLGLEYICGDYSESGYHQLVFHLIFFQIWIRMPFKSEIPFPYEALKYGILTYNFDYPSKWSLSDEILIHLGYKTKRIWLPWHLKFIYYAIQDKNGNWYVEDYKDTNIWKKNKKHRKYFKNAAVLHNNGLYEYIQNSDWLKQNIFYSYNYRYEPLNQESKCKYYVCERCWRPLMFMWTDKFSFKRREIEVEFENEMGPKVGTWKGGTIGCSFKMKEGETPEDCIKRMEKEYNF